MTAVRVPLVDLVAHHAAFGDAVLQAVRRVMASGRFVLGPEVLEFERDAAEFLGARHAVAVSSGTDALLVALLALGVGPGDEVVTTPFSFVATAEAIVRVGARPRFVDVQPATLNLDPAAVTAALGPRTRAVLPVHLFGTPAHVDALSDIAQHHGIALVEDAAQAFGSTCGGRRAGAWGALGCFSFFPAKVLGALGDGGLVVTDDAALAAAGRRLRQHGAESRGDYRQIGGNFRMDAIQAAVLSVKLKRLEEGIRARRAHGAAYDGAFRGIGGLTLLERGAGWNGAVYTVRVRDGRRGALRRHLEERGIETAVYYDPPLHLVPALSHLGVARGSLPESERAATEVLSLPVHAEMTASQRAHVIETVQAFFR